MTVSLKDIAASRVERALNAQQLDKEVIFLKRSVMVLVG